MIAGPMRTEVALPKGRRLVVRPATPEDVDGLVELYRTLPATDRYHRFFAAFRPDRRFMQQWVAVAARGGFLLVAELHEPSSSAGPTIVGEAGCARLPSGDGELGICVVPHWRGWLGPYLLDRLLAAASAGGISHIAADVLWDNRPMLALSHARGGEHVVSEDPAILRVRIPTGPRPARSRLGPSPLPAAPVVPHDQGHKYVRRP